MFTDSKSRRLERLPQTTHVYAVTYNMYGVIHTWLTYFGLSEVYLRGMYNLRRKGVYIHAY